MRCEPHWSQRLVSGLLFFVGLWVLCVVFMCLLALLCVCVCLALLAFNVMAPARRALLGKRVGRNASLACAGHQFVGIVGGACFIEQLRSIRPRRITASRWCRSGLLRICHQLVLLACVRGRVGGGVRFFALRGRYRRLSVLSTHLSRVISTCVRRAGTLTWHSRGVACLLMRAGLFPPPPSPLCRGWGSYVFDCMCVLGPAGASFTHALAYILFEFPSAALRVAVACPSCVVARARVACVARGFSGACRMMLQFWCVCIGGCGVWRVSRAWLALPPGVCVRGAGGRGRRC